MPKRTNDFQKLTDAIQRIYAPKNATITTSAMVVPPSGGAPREVDILVEFETELYPFRVAVEAKDLSRSVDVIGVESYIGKYNSSGSLDVDKVIIVAHSFTKGACVRAKNLGFELHTINELEEPIDSYFSPSRCGARSNSSRSQSGIANAKVVVLLDKKGEAVPLSCRITPRTSKANLGVVGDWLNKFIANEAGKIAFDAYQKHAGQMTKVIIEVDFRGYKARWGENASNLEKMTLDFGSLMVVPPAKAEQFILKTRDENEKTIIRETGAGIGARMHTVFEKPQSGMPKTFVTHHEDLDGGKAKGALVKFRVKFSELKSLAGKDA